MKTIPLPNHGGPAVSVVIEEEIAESIKRDDDVKTPMSVVSKKLEQFGFLVGIHEDYVVCESDLDSCNDMKGCVQELMNQGLIQFSRAKAVEEIVVIEPITIVYRKKKVEAHPKRFQSIHMCVRSLFLYQNTKEVAVYSLQNTILGCLPQPQLSRLRRRCFLLLLHRKGHLYLPLRP